MFTIAAMTLGVSSDARAQECPRLFLVAGWLLAVGISAVFVLAVTRLLG